MSEMVNEWMHLGAAVGRGLRDGCKNSKIGKCWAAVYQSIARRMLSYLVNSEALKVGAKEMEEHVLAPDEPSVNIGHTARQERGEKRKNCSRSLADREQKKS